MSGPAGSRDHQPRGIRAHADNLIRWNARPPERAQETRAFLLTMTFMDAGYSSKWIASGLSVISQELGLRA